MFPHTHKIISQHVHKHVNELLGIQLNKKSLIYGSIEPDLAHLKPHLVKLPHFKPDSFDFICSEINDLSNYSLVPNQYFMKSISKNIGVATHFVADYFCLPHNDREKYKNNFIEHVKYENNLHKLFKSYDSKIDLNNVAHTVCSNKDLSIEEYIDSLHQKYTSQGENLENDLLNSIIASSAVALFVISQSIHKSDYIKAA